MRIIFASNNQGKIQEVKSILNKEIYTLDDVGYNEEIEEYGHTFHTNALIKAQKISQFFPDDIVIADDSGLCVKALNNAPGVYSKRYAKGQKGYEENINRTNNEYLLQNLESIENREAYFQTVICMIKPNHEPIFYSGKLEGLILKEEKGENGFGYDPIFEYNNKSLAQLTAEEKNLISHRKKALEQIRL